MTDIDTVTECMKSNDLLYIYTYINICNNFLIMSTSKIINTTHISKNDTIKILVNAEI